MNMKYLALLLLSTLFLMNCESEKTVEKQGIQEAEPTKADMIFAKTLEAHGGDLYEKANYGFVFRGKNYTFENDGDRFEYTMKYEKNDTTFFERMDNDVFVSEANGEVQKLTKKKASAKREVLNSVIYFATLPHKLKDGAVNKNFVGVTKIKDKPYDILEVTFKEEGGGKDFDDTYHYWINQETSIIDYLAYNYTVNKGGVRFRAANNSRNVNGIVFQDYGNYKAEVGTPLADLPALYEAGELKKLSEINTESVKSLSRGE